MLNASDFQQNIEPTSKERETPIFGVGPKSSELEPSSASVSAVSLPETPKYQGTHNSVILFFLVMD